MPNLRVSIEGKSPYKESYTVNNHWKMFGDVFSDVGACMQFWNSKLFHSFSIFSIYVSYTIYFNQANYVLKYKRMFQQQSR